MKKILFAVALFISFIGLSSFAQAQDHHPVHHPVHHRPVHHHHRPVHHHPVHHPVHH